MTDTSQSAWVSSDTETADDTETTGGTEATDATDATDSAASPQQISKDTQFGMLKNRRRRDILRYLRENGGESTLSDLAEFIAAKENGVERRLLSSDERKRVYIGLYQCHLPKMDDASIIDFEKRSGDVRLRSEADQLFTYIDGVDNTSDAATDEETGALGGLTVGRKLQLALGWSFCLLVVLSIAGISLLPPIGLVGTLVAVTLVTVETVDALPTLWSRGLVESDD